MVPGARADVQRLLAASRNLAGTRFRRVSCGAAGPLRREYQRAEGWQSVYGAPPVVGRINDTAGWNGWYLAAARRFKEKYEVGAYYGKLVQPFDSRGTGNPSNYQDDIALSFRCDVNEHITIKAEYHWIDGIYQTFNTTRIPNPVRNPENNVFAVKTTLSF